MRWLRRRDETQNERLLREARYGADQTGAAAARRDEERPELWSPKPWFPAQASLQVGSPAERRPRLSDVLATIDAPELTSDAYVFVTLPDGSLIVDDACNEDLSRLADAVEFQLSPPYRASASREGDSTWAVLARSIDVLRLAVGGGDLELSSVGGERTFSRDGRNEDAGQAPEELARLGEARGEDYAVHAQRLDGDLWEVDADPL